MTRRKYFALLVSPLVITAATPPEPQALEAANAFAESFNRWGQFRRQMGTVDTKEILAWKETQHLWKKLDRTIKYE